MTPALEVSRCIERIEPLPVGAADVIRAAPIELDALGRHTLAFLTEILALARAAGDQKIIEASITAIDPVELAAQPLKPTGRFQSSVFLAIIEQQMRSADPAGSYFPIEPADHQSTTVSTACHQAWPLNGREGNGGRQLGIITLPCPLPGVSPLKVEYIFAPGVVFAIQRQ